MKRSFVQRRRAFPLLQFMFQFTDEEYWNEDEEYGEDEEEYQEEEEELEVEEGDEEEEEQSCDEMHSFSESAEDESRRVSP